LQRACHNTLLLKKSLNFIKQLLPCSARALSQTKAFPCLREQELRVFGLKKYKCHSFTGMNISTLFDPCQVEMNKKESLSITKMILDFIKAYTK